MEAPTTQNNQTEKQERVKFFCQYTVETKTKENILKKDENVNDRHQETIQKNY